MCVSVCVCGRLAGRGKVTAALQLGQVGCEGGKRCMMKRPRVLPQPNRKHNTRPCASVRVCVCNTQFNCKSNFNFNSHSMCNLNFDFVSADWPRPNGVLGGRAPGSWHMSSAWHGRAANRRLNNCGSSASLPLPLSLSFHHLADDALI